MAVVRESPRSGNARFLRKVLSDSEYHWIAESTDPERALWTLWALKESTYKLEFKRWPRRFFAPKRYVCKFADPGITQASIQTPDGFYAGKIWQDPDYIHAIVSIHATTLNQIEQTCICLPTTEPAAQSIALRKALLAELQHKVPDTPIQISSRGEGSFPRIWYAPDQEGPDLSLSHHGNWGAYAYLFPSVYDSSGL